MENKFTNVKERVIQVAEFHGVGKEKFFEQIGMSYGSFKGKAKETPLNSDALANILTSYPDVNPDWLITGKGSMHRERNMEIQTIARSKSARRLTAQEIPLYDVKATAGIVELMNDHGSREKHIPIDYISIPNLPKCDGAIPITGDSMYPLLKSGDIALYKEVHNYENIIWGEMYLIAIMHEGDEFFFAKFLQKSERKDWVKLVSQNVHHQDKEFPLSSIKALALIKASIRINTAF